MDYVYYIILGVLLVGIVVMFVFSSRRRKKQEQDAQDLINSVKPGNKVKTIGGICGIVVEVDNEENTFVLETGTEQSGKCFIKFDRQAIYQTDAVASKKEEKSVETQEEVSAEITETAESVKAVEATEAAGTETEAAAEEKSVEELRNPPAKKSGKKK